MSIVMRNVARHSGITTAVARGAARGAVAGSVFAHSAGNGAAAGAVVGGTRRVAQKARSYDCYYTSCMNK